MATLTPDQLLTGARCGSSRPRRRGRGASLRGPGPPAGLGAVAHGGDRRCDRPDRVPPRQREVPEALKPRRIEIATASGQASVAQNNVTTLDQSKVP